MPVIARWILLVALTLGAGAGGWWLISRNGTRAQAVTLYYADPQAMYLVPVTQTLELPMRRKQALEQVVSELHSPPPGLHTALPPGSDLEILAANPVQTRLKVRLSTVPGSGSEQLMIKSLVKTAGSLGFTEVAIALFDARGGRLESQHMDLSEPLSPTSPGMENLHLDGEGLAVNVYYRLPRSSYLVPVRVPLSAARSDRPIEGSIALLRDPPPGISPFAASALPPGTDIRWNGLEGNTAQILWKGAMATGSAEAIRAIALTLTQFEEVKAVRVQPEGPGTQPSKPISRPPAVNEVAR